MATRPAHYNTRYKHDLTPRQREVLELIARGRTNAEIAERLGLSLDGAKWHVREILSKLNLDSREQAADYWRNYQRPLARLARAFAAISMPGALKAAFAGGAALGVAGIAVAAVIALRGGGGGAGTVSVAPDDARAAAPDTDCNITGLPVNALVDAGGTARILIEATASAPCTFRGDVLFTLSDETGARAPVDGNPTSVALDLPLVTTPTPLMVASWTNWCGRGAGVALGVILSGGGEGFYALDVPIPTCVDSSLLSVITVVRASNSSYRFPPKAASQLPLGPGLAFAEVFAESLAQQVADGQVGLFINAVSCGLPFRPPTRPGDSTICVTYQHGGQILGFSTVRMLGDLVIGTPQDGQQPERALTDLSLASVGCAMGDSECARFIVAFESPVQPRAVYIVFERPYTGIPQPRLIGMGISGDNADTILNGGVTGTDLGQTLFTRVR